jgi:hypothetical protein
VLYDDLMISEYDAETLRLHAANVAETLASLNKATKDRDDAIRDILNAGGLPTETGRIVGLSRGRINQIKG